MMAKLLKINKRSWRIMGIVAGTFVLSIGIVIFELLKLLF